MTDDEDGHALLMKFAQKFHELLLIFAVLTARRFIEDEILRGVRQWPRRWQPAVFHRD